MNGKNSVQLVGYVGQELKETKSEHGHRVAIRMATHFYMVGEQDGKLHKTTWHNVVAWDRQAGFALGNFVKGSKILVEGRISKDPHRIFATSKLYRESHGKIENKRHFRNNLGFYYPGWERRRLK